jgi:hypothetical protein
MKEKSPRVEFMVDLLEDDTPTFRYTPLVSVTSEKE